MPCPSSSRMLWHRSRHLAGLMTKSLKLTHMSFSPPLTLGNLLSWTMSSAQKMSSPGHNCRIPGLSMIPFFDAQGDLNQRIIATLNTLLDLPDHSDMSTFNINSTSWHSLPHHSLPSDVDWVALKPYFGWAPISPIQNTFKVTTRYGPAASMQDYLKKHFKARNPVFNIPRQNEAVATDTVFSDTPAIADRSTTAQFFCSQDTLVCDAYGIKSTNQFINTLADNIRYWGAMHTLISDRGPYEISKKVTDLLQSLFIADYQSDKAENQWATAKRWINKMMNSSGCPPSAWLLCLQYVCVLLNHMSSPALDGLCPLQALTGQTPDISFLLHFSFWEPIYYRVDPNEPSSNFPSTSNEKKGYWVGFSDNVDDKLTWKILTEDTQHLIIRSAIRSAHHFTPNLHHELPSGESNLPNSNPTSYLTKIHLTSLNSIFCGVSQSVKTTHHSTLIPHLWQISLWMI